MGLFVGKFVGICGDVGIIYLNTHGVSIVAP